MSDPILKQAVVGECVNSMEPSGENERGKSALTGGTRGSVLSDLFARTLSRLSERLFGRVWTTGENGCAEATATWARPTGPVPPAVAHYRTAADVHTAIRAARDCDLRLSVHGRGHDRAGCASCDGLAVDPRGLNGVPVGSGRTTHISGGPFASQVAAATHPVGLAVVTGAVGALGAAGLAHVVADFKAGTFKREL